MQKRLFSPITISTIWNWTSIGHDKFIKQMILFTINL